MRLLGIISTTQRWGGVESFLEEGEFELVPKEMAGFSGWVGEVSRGRRGLVWL